MRNLIRKLRQKFHPLFYARKSAIGRTVIRLLDQPAWLTVQGVNFKVRGRLLTHGLAFAVIGSQEENPEALATACMRHLRLCSFWDVGANIGHYTWLMKTLNPEVEAVLFEPLPTNQALIRDTLKRNALQKTTLIPAAVSDGSGDGILNADFMAGATSTLAKGGSTFEQRHWGKEATQIGVSLVSIDETRQNHGVIDLMKIDVEGHEETVLRGARRTIASDQPLLLIECGHSHHSCLNSLESFGYTILSADHLSTECNGNTLNYLCVPPRFASSIEALLRMAHLSAQSSLTMR